MIPILFEANTTNFYGTESYNNTQINHGLGDLIDTTACVVQFNEDCSYEMELSYPANGKMLPELTPGRIIVAKSDIFRQTRYKPYQAFRIYGSERNIDDGITVKCQHISYDLDNLYSFPGIQSGSYSGENVIFTFPISGNLNSVLQEIKNKTMNGTCPFTFTSNVSRTSVNPYVRDVIYMPVNEPTSIRSILFNGDSSVKGCWGGEWVFNNFSISALEPAGVDTTNVIEYGRNMIEISHEEDITNLVTGVMPYYLDKDKEYPDAENRMIYLFGDTIRAEGTFLRENIVPVNLTSLYNEYGEKYASHFAGQVIDGQYVDMAWNMEENPTFEHFNTVCQLWAKSIKLGVPEISLTVKASEVEEPLYMYDSLKVHYDALDIDVIAKVSSCTYDVLNERCTEFDVGNTKSSSMWRGIYSEGKDIKKVFVPGVTPSW